MRKSVQDIAGLIKGEVVGDKGAQISSVSSMESAKENELAFAFSKEHLEKLEETGASCVVVPKDFNGPSKKTLIKTPNPKEAFVNLLSMFHKPEKRVPGTHERAVVSKRAKIGKGVYIGPCTVIEDGAEIGDNTIIEAGAYVGKGSRVGSRTTIHPNVVIYHNCFVGNNVIIHSGTVIGSDGFGFIQKDGIHHKIPQVGKVIVEDDVEIGSNVSIDRATIGETLIGKGTKLDNLIQVAHNLKIGKNVIIAGQSGIAGSTVIEDNVTIAAQVGIKDHIRIGRGAIIGAKSAVKDDVEPGKIVVGIPAKDARECAKELAAISKLTKNISKIFRLLKQDPR
ncbi:MAG: UDP-3-O-(3-hydroxymyristoyl)glucosamine N-acyltransferase [Candidatus Omnitrophica bacterium]|nr:UDP-3-O-(3-hydroxymyristoyl)glucosamine N-acyltransferase [Candidatus Omnitrophota bacterium]